MPASIHTNGNLLVISDGDRVVTVFGLIIGIFFITAPVVTRSWLMALFTIPMGAIWLVLFNGSAITKQRIEIDREQRRISKVVSRYSQETVTQQPIVDADEIGVVVGPEPPLLSSSLSPDYWVVIRSTLESKSRYKMLLGSFRMIEDARGFAEQIAEFVQLPLTDEN